MALRDEPGETGQLARKRVLRAHEPEDSSPRTSPSAKEPTSGGVNVVARQEGERRPARARPARSRRSAVQPLPPRPARRARRGGRTIRHRARCDRRPTASRSRRRARPRGPSLLRCDRQQLQRRHRRGVRRRHRAAAIRDRLARRSRRRSRGVRSRRKLAEPGERTVDALTKDRDCGRPQNSCHGQNMENVYFAGDAPPPGLYASRSSSTSPTTCDFRSRCASAGALAARRSRSTSRSCHRKTPRCTPFRLGWKGERGGDLAINVERVPANISHTGYVARVKRKVATCRWKRRWHGLTVRPMMGLAPFALARNSAQVVVRVSLVAALALPFGCGSSKRGATLPVLQTTMLRCAATTPAVPSFNGGKMTRPRLVYISDHRTLRANKSSGRGTGATRTSSSALSGRGARRAMLHPRRDDPCRHEVVPYGSSPIGGTNPPKKTGSVERRIRGSARNLDGSAARQNGSRASHQLPVEYVLAGALGRLPQG